MLQSRASEAATSSVGVARQTGGLPMIPVRGQGGVVASSSGDGVDAVFGLGGVEGGFTVPEPSPLTVTAPLLLRTHELSWEALEHLVVALAVRADHALEARPFGRGGQAQNGIDVVAFFASESISVYQAKRYEKFAATDLRKAVHAYADGSRPFGAQRLVIVTTADVRDTRVDLELARLREQHQDLVIDLWGRQQLSDMLFALPDLVRRFFGEHTMQVFCRPLPEGVRPDSSGEADVLGLEGYLAQLSAYLSEELHELVPLILVDQDGAEQVSSAGLAAWVRPGRHVQVAGGSGTGKSHTLTHAALELARIGWLPILLRAGIYEGRLQESLEECVAPFSPNGVQGLVQTARSREMPVVLFVDAINECPAPSKERLVQQVSAWCRDTGATVVSSSQEFVRVPAVLGCIRLRTTDPGPQERAALLRSYGVGLEAEGLAKERCTAFSTAFELSLAARLTQRVPFRAGRGALLGLYVGEQLQRTSQPTAVRQVLHRWALLMDERLAGWLPLAEAQRSAAQLLAAQGVAAGVVDEALGSPMVRVQHQRVEFRHEWYAHLLTAEALVWRCVDVAELADELGRSHRRELAAWAVQLYSNPEAVRGLLRELPSSEVFIEALRGHLGQVADEVMLAEARGCLEETVEAAVTSRITFISDIRYAIEPDRAWSAYEQAVFTAVGTTARVGRLLEPLARLLRETDRAFRRGAAHATARYRDAVPALLAATLNGPVIPAGDGHLPAAVITHAARLAWPRPGHAHHQTAGAAELQQWVATLDTNDVGLTVLLCILLRKTDDAETAALAPALFCRAWASGAGHLRFAGLDLLTSIRTTADEATVAQVIELLNGLHTDEVFVSTMLVDTLHIYGQVSSPYAVDDIAEEIRLLLSAPDQPDAHARAKRIVESQFEDVIAAPFTEAIDALDPAEHRALLILAVREGDVSLFTDVFLKELMRAKDPAALPALQYWASHLDVRTPFRQDAVSCHLLGVEGCAAHLPAPPPLLEGHQSVDADAWRCYSQILFCLHRPGLSLHEQQAHCLPLWEQLNGPLLDAAVDPLHQFQYVAQFAQDISTSALARLVDAFPSQARTILHHGLSAPDRLTSLFPHPLPHDRTTTVLRLLARAGDHSSLPVLAAYRDHPTLGDTATDTIRHINNRATPRA